MTTGRSFWIACARIRPAPGWMLAAFIAVHTGVLLGTRTAAFEWGVAGPLLEATDGWARPTLAAILVMAAAVGVLFGVVGRMRAADLGLTGGWRGGCKGLNAVLLTYLLWGVAQLLVVGAGLVGLTEVSLNPAWMRPLNPALLGASATTVLAGAVLEEVMYRGFLFVHLLLLLRRWGLGRTGALWGALAGSQLVFGLNHVPVGLAAGFAGSTLVLYVLQVSLVGVMFCVLFVQTNNLYFVMGAHALLNHPELPFVAGVHSSFVVLLVVLGLMLARPVLGRVGAGAQGPRPPVFGAAPHGRH